jgi:putative phage-type endonuclease
MKIHELIQGSPEWHAYRAEHYNASDAPAMMGVSAYKTRSKLLQEMHTGLSEEVDASTQRRFDDGHRFEAMARPLAEEIIGQELYPVVGSEGKLSASFDGLTLAEDIAFEHKTLNDELRAAMVEGCTGADLPMGYQVQMEQQCMVSGCTRVFFMATKWKGEELLEARDCWYTPNPELATRIASGWDLFAEDLANYKPEVPVVEAVGRAPENLPALRIEVTGTVTASNLLAFKEHALAVFKGINTELTTDQQFADAEKTVKWCGEVEEKLAAAKQHALSQTESIDALFRAIDEIAAEARAKRLELDRLVTKRKEAIRAEILSEGSTALAEHIKALNERLTKPYMPAVPADFAGAMKGKRTVASLRDAVTTVLNNAKIESSAIADRIQANLMTLRELASEHAFLFADTAQIVLKANDDLTMLVKSRINDHLQQEEKRLEAERERIRQEEQSKLAAQEQASAAIAQAAAPTPAPATATATVRTYGGTASAKYMKLGEITERLGFTLTSEFLSRLGFEPVGTDRTAKLYRESDFRDICAELVRHINAIEPLTA